ncbi:MAG: 2-amino-4-hydroxy-6-hydroxymethyldihydropteridine diphosphokinase [Thermoleophilia bacterium]
MARAYLSLGCNLGNCRAYLVQAIGLLNAHPLISVTRVSSVYLTEAVGEIEQPDFLNLAAELETDLSPRVLLDACQRVEEELGGADRGVPHGPRTIDLDILLYEQREIAGAELTVPHPRMLERAFVLRPLTEIAPEARLPGGRTVAEAAASLCDEHAVEEQGPLDLADEGQALS